LLVQAGGALDAPSVETRGRFEEAFGQVLRRVRLDARRSQEDVAAAAGLSTYYLRELEYGRKSASLSAVVRLAGALGRRPHELIREAEAGWKPGS
jgi:transcriptional regulator with XRE-family HTH domain